MARVANSPSRDLMGALAGLSSNKQSPSICPQYTNFVCRHFSRICSMIFRACAPGSRNMRNSTKASKKRPAWRLRIDELKSLVTAIKEILQELSLTAYEHAVAICFNND